MPIPQSHVFYLVFLSLTFITNLHAETYNAYVSDNLTIPVIDHPDSKKIIQSLYAGNKIRILSSNIEGWSKIKLSGDKTGWIRTEQTSVTPRKQNQIDSLLEETEKLRETLNHKRKEINFLQTELQQLKEDNTIFRKNDFIISTELKKFKDLSKGPLEVEQTNQQLLKQVEFLKFNNTVLSKSIKNIERQNNEDWQTLLIIAGLCSGLVGYLWSNWNNKRKLQSWKL